MCSLTPRWRPYHKHTDGNWQRITTFILHKHLTFWTDTLSIANFELITEFLEALHNRQKLYITLHSFLVLFLFNLTESCQLVNALHLTRYSPLNCHLLCQYYFYPQSISYSALKIESLYWTPHLLKLYFLSNQNCSLPSLILSGWVLMCYQQLASSWATTTAVYGKNGWFHTGSSACPPIYGHEVSNGLSD